VAEAHHVLRSL
jgi:hypothetical protein